MKKFLFVIVPSFENALKASLDTRIEVTPPYGPLAILSFVKSKVKDIEFEVLDLKAMAVTCTQQEMSEHLLSVLSKKQFDYIGISALFSVCLQHLQYIVETIEKSSSKAVVVVGGALATCSYAEILRLFPRIDMVCYGEGEVPIFKLIQSDNPLEVYLESNAVITRKSLQIGQKPELDFLHCLDEIGGYDFSYIDSNSFYGIHKSHKSETKNIEIITSRGCPYNCIFCSCKLMYGKKIRFHSEAWVKNQISNFIDQGFSTIRFFDENFFFDKQRAKNILQHIYLYGCGNICIEFPNGMMTAKIDEEIVVLLKKCKLVRANLAVESGSDFVLSRIIKKPVTVAIVDRVVQLLKKYNIEICIYIVTGFPGETDAHRLETMKFLKRIKPDWVQIVIATPFMGSRLYDICVKNNFLVHYDIFNISMKKCYINTPEYSNSYIEDVAYNMNLDINFLNNTNINNGCFTKALVYFEDVYSKFSEHAFAYYAASKCLKSLNRQEDAIFCFEKFQAIIRNNSFWHEKALKFQIAHCDYRSM